VLGQFEYLRPTSLDDAVRVLAEHTGRASILAGGTDLLVEIRNRVRTPNLLLDIKEIEALRRFEVPDSGPVVLGAAVPLNPIAENARLRRRLPGLAQAARSIATYQLRNRATLVGNLCNASPAADAAPVLLVLGAVLRVKGPSGERDLPVSELFAGVKKTSLAASEIVVEVQIPDPSRLRTAFVKQQRIRGHDLAVVNAAAAFDPKEGSLRIAIGSCAPTPVLLEPIEAAGDSCEDFVERAIERARSVLHPIDDVRASAAYRKAVLPALLRRLIADVVDMEGGV
jgi:CO/xanthine dehydrogenase FAD-binding subunit